MYVGGGKRALDLTLGAVLALVVLPVILVFAAVSAIGFRTWPIFVQPRVGRNGRIFRFPKIRTLPPSTYVAADKYALESVPIPRWAHALRQSHLDELPQLLLVPFGRMSLVGPRPEMPGMCDRYPREFIRARLAVRPGCTGLWQISQATPAMIYEAPEYDLTYLERMSLGLDLWVLWRSVVMVFVPWTIRPLAMLGRPFPGFLERRPLRIRSAETDSAEVRTENGLGGPALSERAIQHSYE
jgi:lipopolysaccharide/colanic/teichoic acid biosynthesis glycosyltransferase